MKITVEYDGETTEFEVADKQPLEIFHGLRKSFDIIKINGKLVTQFFKETFVSRKIEPLVEPIIPTPGNLIEEFVVTPFPATLEADINELRAMDPHSHWS